MSTIAFLVWLVVPIAYAVAWVVRDRSGAAWNPSLARLSAASARATRRTLADALPGEHVAILGIVDGTEELRAPLSGKPCVLYRVEIFDHVTHQLVGQLTRAHEFVIADDTGRASIDPGGAELRLSRARPTLRYERELLADVLPLAHVPRDRVLIAYEGRLSRGQSVTVIGSVEAPSPPAESVYRSAAVCAPIAIGGANGAGLVVSDLDADRRQFDVSPPSP
jgi:hypothetical protein